MKIWSIIVLLPLLAGCDPEPSKTLTSCVKKKTKTDVVYWPSDTFPGGVHVGGGMHLVTKTECLKWETQRNPEYDEWLRRQEREG